MVSKAALHKRTSQNPAIGPKVNFDSPQRTPVSPTRLQDAIIRAKYSHFCLLKFSVKKMNYDHCTDCNLLPTDAGGITSPDIRLIVHKRKFLTLYSKQILPPQHILRAFLGKAVPFPGNERILCRSSSAQTRLSHLVSKAALHKRRSQNPPHRA